jgi:hypothetical protein|tara:strand:+ start:964 stop:1155 length:192 start_codon:yes stop_codon:yes gene_type:complete
MNHRQFEIYCQLWNDFINGIDINNVKATIEYEKEIEDYESVSARLLALNEFMYYKDIIRKLLK